MESLTNSLRWSYLHPVVSACLVIISVSFAYFCWMYWKMNRAYTNFPTHHFDIEWVLKLLIEGIPKDVPVTSVAFQEILKACRRFLKEGFVRMWLFRPYMFIYSQEFFKICFNEPSLVDKPSVYAMVEDVLGSGLFTSNGSLWKKHRKLLNPSFRLGALKGHMRIFNKNASLFVKELEDIAETPTIDLMRISKRCSFNIMSESILGLTLNDEKYGHIIENYMKSLEEGSEMFVYRIFHPWLHWKILLPFFSAGRKYLKSADEIKNFTREIIEEMMKSSVSLEAPEEVLDIEEDCKKSFALRLLEQHQKDPTFTMTDVIDHVTTIMIAGHDTVANALMWCFYLLGLHEEIQEKAFKEAERLPGRDVTYDDLNDLKYLECVIKETLRLYPVGPIYARKLSKEIQCGNNTIPKGTELVFFLYLMHRNPNIYPDPEKFNPERFLENSDIRPWMYTPFAEGYRNCIGRKFAMMEFKVVLAHILRHYEIKTMEKMEEIDLDWTVFLKSTKPMRILLKFRQPRSLDCVG